MLRSLIKECSTIHKVYQQQNIQAMNSIDGKNIQTILSRLDDKKISSLVLKLMRDCPQKSINYINALSCPQNTYSIGIFILNKGVTIPFHDHPLMVVASKVLYGKGQIESYTLQSNHQIQLSYPFLDNHHCNQSPCLIPVKDYKIEQVEEGQIMWTFPIDSNIHSFSNRNTEPFAFIDVLVPQYDFKERFCNFYEKTSDKSKLLMRSNTHICSDLNILNVHLDLDEFFI